MNTIIKSAGITRVEVIVSIIVALLVGAIVSACLSPVAASIIAPASKAQAKNDVTQIATAVIAYDTEYDHLPPMPTNSLVSGELVSALVGSNQTLNPRKIAFIEIGTAKKGKTSGLRDGTFVDPWGGPYHIAIATATNNFATITAGTNQVTLHKKVAVWNDPVTHPKPLFGDDPKRNARRYVTSWD